MEIARFSLPASDRAGMAGIPGRPLIELYKGAGIREAALVKLAVNGLKRNHFVSDDRCGQCTRVFQACFGKL